MCRFSVVWNVAEFNRSVIVVYSTMYIFESVVRDCKYGTYVINMQNKIIRVSFTCLGKNHFVLKNVLQLESYFLLP